jgi:hypothetical protein
MTNFVCNSMSSLTASSNCQNSHKSLYLFLHFYSSPLSAIPFT